MKKTLLILIVLLTALLVAGCTQIEDENPPAESKIVSISVSGTKKTFGLGDIFTPGTAFKVKAQLEDNSTRVLSEEEYELDSSAFDGNTVGKYTIHVSVTDTEIGTSYEVTVKQNALKILSIGNSFSEDSHEYLFNVITALTDYNDVVTVNLGIGGCSLDSHYDNIVNNNASYIYRRQTAEGGVEVKTGYSILTALREERWDYITIQQVSQDSGRPETISLEKLQYIKSYFLQYCTNPKVKIAWHSTWAYAQNSTHAGFANYGNDQTAMYNAIVNVAKTTIPQSGCFDIVIPNMTSIQNARTSYVGDTLNRDGFHLSLDRGRFIAALTFYKALTGNSIDAIVGVDSRRLVGTSTYAKNVDEKFKQMAVECVNNAVQTPYQVTPSQYTA